MTWRALLSEDVYFSGKQPLYLARSDHDGQAVVTGITFEKRTYQAAPYEPPIDDGIAFLQAMLDYAWSIGLRPAAFSDRSLQVAAMQDHIADLRKMAFNSFERTRSEATNDL